MDPGTGSRENKNTGIAAYLLKPREESILIFCGVLLALIFILDISLVIGFVVSILYVVPVLMCIWSPRRRTIFLVAGVASILTLVAVPLKPSGELLFPLLNRPLSLIALWTVALLIDRFTNERKKAEQALRESEGRLILAQQVANIGTFEWNIQTGVNVWTAELEAMYGLAQGTFPGTQLAWEALVHPDDREEAVHRVGEAIKKGSFEGEWRVVWPDGSVHWLLGRGWVFKDDEGRPLKLLGVNIDDTERKIAQQSIEESKRNEQARRQELEALMGAVPATIWISRDPEGTNMVGNKATEELLGVQPGSNVSETAPLEQRQQHFHAYRDGKAITPSDLPMQEAGRTGKAVEGIEFEIRFDDGRSVWLYGNAVPLKQDGKIRGAVGAFVNITERKKAEEALKHSNTELQQFAYVASHDMQEPLRMITLYLDLLNIKFSTDINPKAKEYMGFINSGAERIRQLVDDLLQYSRVDSQPIECTEVEMNGLANLVINDLHIAIDNLEAEIWIDQLPTIHANETQMKQVLTNLISNAIKFHGDLKPRVEISAVSYGNEYVFLVKDNGIGIDPKYADKLFKMFSRLHTNEEYPGTGIGLAVAKKIIERHGGRIWFESEPGKGTTFYFTISARSS